MASRRKSKQKSKYLGRRRFGSGDVKNKRGSGNRGGRGNAGRCKHKGTWVAKYAPGYFGKLGFVNPTGKETPVSHLYEINQQALTNKLQKKGGMFYFEFKGKILSTGKVTVPLHIKALKWSKNVEQKLKNAGGMIEKHVVQAKPATEPKQAGKASA